RYDPRLIIGSKKPPRTRRLEAEHCRLKSLLQVSAANATDSRDSCSCRNIHLALGHACIQKLQDAGASRTPTIDVATSLVLRHLRSFPGGQLDALAAGPSICVCHREALIMIFNACRSFSRGRSTSDIRRRSERMTHPLGSGRSTIRLRYSFARNRSK